MTASSVRETEAMKENGVSNIELACFAASGDPSVHIQVASWTSILKE